MANHGVYTVTIDANSSIIGVTSIHSGSGYSSHPTMSVGSSSWPPVFPSSSGPIGAPINPRPFGIPFPSTPPLYTAIKFFVVDDTIKLGKVYLNEIPNNTHTLRFRLFKWYIEDNYFIPWDDIVKRLSKSIYPLGYVIANSSMLPYFANGILFDRDNALDDNHYDVKYTKDLHYHIQHI